MLGTHAAKLERWLGAEKVERLSESMRTWYGPPIAVSGVPGQVFVAGGGDFRGSIKTGAFASVRDSFETLYNRVSRNSRRLARGATLFTGFASFADLLAESKAGKLRYFPFFKTGVGLSGGTSRSSSLWFRAAFPEAGSAAGAAPGGTAWDDTATGTWSFTNPDAGDTQHLAFANLLVFATAATGQLLLYDRLFSVTKTMNSVGPEAVSGVPTRYTSTTAGAENSAEGNFLFAEARAAMPATAHNWTPCLYLDQAGNAETLPSVTGLANAPAGFLDQPIHTWFMPLATGDRGISALTQLQCSALVATGNVDFTIGHPLAWIPCRMANALNRFDLTSAPLSLARVFDDACLAMLEPIHASDAATTYTGDFQTVAG